MFCRATTISPSALRRRLAAFARAERGSILVFVLTLFVLMLMIGGLAVDLMRYEQRRTALQQTLDRSVLAAASLTQDLDPESVVYDWFEKAGQLDYLTSVTVTEGLNFRNVDATAHAEMLPVFAQMVGIDRFDVPAAGQAEQRITNVEIVLVLDVSGSMLNNNRLVNLKTAAREFVQTVLGNDGDNRISVSLVPFNGQVNLGPVLRGKFNAIYPHGTANVNCVDLPASVYSSLTMSRTLPLPMTAHADTFSTTTQSTSWVAIQGHSNSSGKLVNNWCPPSTGNVVTVMGTDVATLQARINALEGIGATSINAGLRWGLTLIDPAQRPLVSELVGAGAVPPEFNGRPFDFTDDEAMKVIVLMTDGEHFAEERINDTYKGGNAPIWFSATDNAFMIQHVAGRPASAGANQYWYPARNSGAGEWRSDIRSGYVQQTWPQVWARARVSWVAWQLYARALGTSSATRTSKYNEWMGNFRTQTSTAAMDDQLESVCDLAKARGVVIYGIAFEAPAGGQAAISNCASSPAYYYNATGLEIQSAFRSIAANISQLRLTQ